ncbi:MULTISPECIES: EAL domain-containing protein [unclassified Pseudomonas]|uniref:putative bifunctional diguanylate cyclase/phosphodiesterase n=1 Tax=unclassified Pseudomonas TaxID=196821 RepID=UPI000D3A2C83|nr:MULTISPECIES: EAL domain-containing protein [unclassified Pseudomonas]RAU44617.1 EAL domain-containing protein [Pseudomonas sp. RIT 409]RAU54947.1 EAL domain-containing protein [Pseudomonas sp. RIT 412]
MFKTNFADWAATRRSRQLILRLFPAICALLLLIGLSGFLLVQNALNQDRDVQQRSRIFIARTLEQVRNEVGRNIINYAKWGEAYKHLHMTVDKVWADDQRNVGPIPYELYGYNGVLVIDARDRTRYAVIDGKPSMIQAGDWLEGDLDGLVRDVRLSTQSNDGLVRAFRVAGVPALVAAATISPESDPTIQPVPGPASVMMFVTILDPVKLNHLSDTYGLPSISLYERPEPGYDVMPLLESTILLKWMPPRPGMALLKQTLPLFISGVLLLAVVLAMLVRYAWTLARQIDAQFQALHASQLELSGSEQRFRQLSLHDSLTGLANRFRLHQFLDEHLGHPVTWPLTVLSLDLDRFKPINDALGHAVGDRVLQEVARRLQAHVHEGDMVARLGGDEFIVVLVGEVGEGDVVALCSRLVEEVCRPIEVEGQTVFIGTSIGIARAPADGHTGAELLSMGDIALYQAKAAGRNTWRFYVDSMKTHLLARRQLEHELRTALLNDQLCVHYQPRYATVDGSLRSLEALVRWQHPERGLLPPDAFITLAEDTGLIQPLGRWVLERACRDAMDWPPEVGLSVNLSPGQLADHEDIVAVVAQALHGSGLSARRLELEITERVLLDHAQGAKAALTALRTLGVRLSLDDFGTGFSSLAYLRQYPLDGIKIDRSFIAHLTERGNDLAIVQAMIDLGRSLGMTVTAEGVETQAQLECLRRHPCDEVQGFHFSRAVPADQLAPLFGRAPSTSTG